MSWISGETNSESHEKSKHFLVRVVVPIWCVLTTHDPLPQLLISLAFSFVHLDITIWLGFSFVGGTANRVIHNLSWIHADVFALSHCFSISRGTPVNVNAMELHHWLNNSSLRMLLVPPSSSTEGKYTAHAAAHGIIWRASLGSMVNKGTKANTYWCGSTKKRDSNLPISTYFE